MAMKVGSWDNNYEAYREATQKKETTDIGQAKKDYIDEYLTGLTEDEKELMDQLCSRYREEHAIETKADRQAYLSYVKLLLKQFGFKGDINAYAEGYTTGTGVIEDGEPLQKPSGIQEAGNSESLVVKESDGNTYLVVTSKTGAQYKIKIADGMEVKKPGEELGANQKNRLENGYDTIAAFENSTAEDFQA